MPGEGLSDHPSGEGANIQPPNILACFLRRLLPCREPLPATEGADKEEEEEQQQREDEEEEGSVFVARGSPNQSV